MNKPVPWDDISDEEEDLDAREPWMWGGKRAFVFLIDASEAMFAPDLNSSSYFEECIEACKKIMLSRIVQEQKDLIAIVLFGTKHKDQTGQPNHVHTFQELDYPSGEKVQALIKISEDLADFERQIGHSKDFCIGDALWHCNKMINNCKSKLFEKTIFLLTSNDNPHPSNQSLQSNAFKRALDLKPTRIGLRVIPLGLKFNLDIFYQELINSAYGDNNPSFVVPKSMDDVLRNIDCSVTKRSVVKLVWSLGGNVKLAVGVYTISRAANLPKKVKIERTKNEMVQSRAQYFSSNSGEEVLRTDIVRSAKFADETVTYEPEEILAVKQISPPGLVLLGFKPVKRILIEHHLKNAVFIYPEERRISGSRTLFAALHTQCMKRKVVALCIYTARRNSRPELVALIPQKEELGPDNVQITPPGFVLVYLPYADNIRDLSTYAVQCPDPGPELVTIAERILDELKFDYNPHEIDNPRIAFHWAGIEAIALNYNAAKTPLDHTLPKYDIIDKKIGSLADQFMQLAFPDGFNEKQIISSSKAKHPSATKPKAYPKKPKVELDPNDMENIARNSHVEKLKVDQLKRFLNDNGVRTSKMKKDELVKAVYDYFEIDQP